MSFTVENLRQIKLPVTDLQSSVDWYRELLGVELHREFVEDGQLVGAVLRHRAGGFVISLRLRTAVPGRPHFSGFDLFSLGVRNLDDLRQLMEYADTLGIDHSELVDRGPDGHHLDLYDPDRTAIRFLTPAADNAPAFAGVVFDENQVPSFYDRPRLR